MHLFTQIIYNITNLNKTIIKKNPLVSHFILIPQKFIQIFLEIPFAFRDPYRGENDIVWSDKQKSPSCGGFVVWKDHERLMNECVVQHLFEIPKN